LTPFIQLACFKRKTTTRFEVRKRDATTSAATKIKKRAKTSRTAKRNAAPQGPIYLIGVGAKKTPNYLPSTIKFYKNAPKSQTALWGGALFCRVFLQV